MLSANQRILCVDDNDDTCYMLITLFGRANYQVQAAGSVDAALKLAQSEPFDLYILDKRFPDGAGVDLCRRLRELTPRTPIIFYSGDAYESDRREALAAGAHSYLTKPQIDLLVETVNRLLTNGKDAAS